LEAPFALGALGLDLSVLAPALDRDSPITFVDPLADSFGVADQAGRKGRVSMVNATPLEQIAIAVVQKMFEPSASPFPRASRWEELATNA
jgi:hypothetical protein